MVLNLNTICVEPKWFSFNLVFLFEQDPVYLYNEPAYMTTYIYMGELIRQVM